MYLELELQPAFSFKISIEMWKYDIGTIKSTLFVLYRTGNRTK